MQWGTLWAWKFAPSFKSWWPSTSFNLLFIIYYLNFLGEMFSFKLEWNPMILSQCQVFPPPSNRCMARWRHYATPLWLAFLWEASWNLEKKGLILCLGPCTNLDMQIMRCYFITLDFTVKRLLHIQIKFPGACFLGILSIAIKETLLRPLKDHICILK